MSQICRERNVSILGPEDEASQAIVFEAAGRRFDAFHYPLLENIRKTGYRPLRGPPITMLRGASHLFVVDRKNRTSIRAAMGETDVKKRGDQDAPYLDFGQYEANAQRLSAGAVIGHAGSTMIGQSRS